MTLLLLLGEPGASAAVDQQILAGTAERSAVPYGATLTVAGTSTADISARVYARSAPSTLVVTLDQSWGRRWQEELNEPGSGQLTLHNTDPDLDDIGDGDLVRFLLKGRPVFTMLAQEWEEVTISPSEELDQATTISGPGHVAILEEAVVYPARGTGRLPVEEDRVFNWTAEDYDDSGWPYATAVARYGSGGGPWTGPDGTDYPREWPATYEVYGTRTPWWIWASSGTASNADPGTCYFRKTWLCETPGVHRFYVVGDNILDFYVDGQEMISGETDFTDTHYVELDLSYGVHVMAAAVTNAPDDHEPGNNPGGLLAAVFLVDDDGEPFALGDETNGLGGTTDPVQKAWRIAEYPPGPPGMTPGQVIRKVVDEAQARGALTGVTLGFTDWTDSDGEPWPTTADIATKVGTDVLTFLREMSATYIDFAMRPGSLVLDAWRKDGRGSTTSVTLTEPTDPTDPLTGNLTELVHRRST